MRTLATKFLRAVEATSEAVRRRRGMEEGLRPGDRDACASFAAAGRGDKAEGALDALAAEWGAAWRRRVGLGKEEKVVVGERVEEEEEEEEDEEDGKEDFVDEEEDDEEEEEPDPFEGDDDDDEGWDEED